MKIDVDRQRKKIIINGRFLEQKITGVQRYAREIIRELDNIVEKGICQLIIPSTVDIETIHYKNIEVKKLKGRKTGILWDLISYSQYVRKKKGLAVNLYNVAPLVKDSVVCVHDVTYRANFSFHTSLKDRLRTVWHCWNYWVACNFSKVILTVSEFSKSEIMKYYHVPAQRIHIINCAWQHMERINMSQNIFERYTSLEPGEYFFAMSILSANKNFKWVLQVAKANPDQVFAIAGDGKKISCSNDLSNVHFLGYVSDEDAKSLMANCKAFLFPTIYEGFGLPPLEAIGSGAKCIVVSNIDVMHEIYGDAAVYIDPYDSYIDVEEIAKGNPNLMLEVLEKYSWKSSAKKLLEILYKIR